MAPHRAKSYCIDEFVITFTRWEDLFMALDLKRIDYDALNARQKENYNFLKLSSLLADFGFMTMRLNDDWQGADFIAQHIDGRTFLKVQLKGRLDFRKKYCDKSLYVAFCWRDAWAFRSSSARAAMLRDSPQKRNLDRDYTCLTTAFSTGLWLATST